MKRLRKTLRKRRLAKLQISIPYGIPQRYNDTYPSPEEYSPVIQSEIQEIRDAINPVLQQYVGNLNTKETRQHIIDNVRRVIGRTVLYMNNYLHVSNVEIDEHNPSMVNIELTMPKPIQYITLNVNQEELSDE